MQNLPAALSGSVLNTVSLLISVLLLAGFTAVVLLTFRLVLAAGSGATRMQHLSEALSGWLLAETVLALSAATPLGTVPLTNIQLLSTVTVVLLWLVLVGHLVADCWGLLRGGEGHLAGRGRLDVGFRAVESLGVVAVPVVFIVLASRMESPNTMGAMYGMLVVYALLAWNAAVVLLHASWRLGTGITRQSDPTPTS